MPADIDYPSALALRQLTVAHGHLPQYLLAVEVSALLHYVPDLNQQTLLATLWNTGGRINEVLALTRSSFNLDGQHPYVTLATLKQRETKVTRGRKVANPDQPANRIVFLSDHNYVNQLQMMIATLKIPVERRNKNTRLNEPVKIWGVTDRTVRSWIDNAVSRAAADGVHFSIPITPHTFRHSYAMHMLYAGVPLKVLQALLGHKSLKSTEIYTQIFALDVAAQHRVQFQLPGDDAVAMLKHLTR